MRVRPSIAEIDVHKVNYWNISEIIFPYLVGMLKQGCQLKQSIMHAYAGAKTAIIIGATSLKT